MSRIVVVGSGASAVHFALTALEKGIEVLMLDVGRTGHPVPNARDNWLELKANLPDPAGYFLGERFEGLVYPGRPGEYYGFPPHKEYVFAPVAQFRSDTRGFAPLSSFAAGGLAEAWTGGAYPFNEDDLGRFPVSYGDLEPYYALIARRIGITGESDDLAPFLPLHDGLIEPLRLDEHSKALLERYQANREAIRRLGCFVGRSRTATLSRDHDGRKACGYLGRCLWGCPLEAFYTPALTLRKCLAFEKFTYVPGRYVSHFRFDRARRVTTVVTERVDGGPAEEFAVDRLVLAAGTLSSARILLESIFRQSGEVLTLPGLMDNRQLLMPYLNLRLIGRPFAADTYQYHQLALALVGAAPEDYVHGLITTLKTALIHPIVQSVPLDFRSSLFLFRNVHAALGLVNINFADTRRPENFVTLATDGAAARPRLFVSYSPPAGESARIRSTLKVLRRVFRRLGCVVPPGMTHVRPMGASVHYAGTLPMSRETGDFTTTTDCCSRDFPNLIVADGSTFPFLPAKNLTLTLMANAARVADHAF
jgi:choline dehydrogenase-like flavoprotein